MNPLDEAKRARLRELVDEHLAVFGKYRPMEIRPATVLALLDMVERQGKALKQIEDFDVLRGLEDSAIVMCKEMARAASSTEERA